VFNATPNTEKVATIRTTKSSAPTTEESPRLFLGEN